MKSMKDIFTEKLNESLNPLTVADFKKLDNAHEFRKHFQTLLTDYPNLAMNNSIKTLFNNKKYKDAYDLTVIMVNNPEIGNARKAGDKGVAPVKMAY